MGQKVNPNAIRLGINRDWIANWYPSNNKDWAKWLGEDKKIRIYFSKVERKYFIGKIDIKRNQTDKINVILHTSRPGAVLGKEGKNINDYIVSIQKLLKDKNRKIDIDVVEIKNADLSAQLIANEIATALENRASFRITQKKMLFRVMKAGATGIKTQVSGRLNGVEMARSEGYSRGTVPLQTFRNEIDFAIAEAKTTYGILGVKVWISKQEILKGQNALKAKSFDKYDDYKKPNLRERESNNVTTKENKI